MAPQPQAPVQKRCRVNARVSIISARGLRAADAGVFGGKSDPYCIVEIEGRPKSKCQTEVIKKTLTPEWDWEHVLEGATPGDALLFSVYDYDVIGADDLLGSCRLEYDDWMPAFDGEMLLDVQKPKPGKESYLNVSIQADDPPQDNTDRHRVYVKVLNATRLRAADRAILGGEGSSDPYCIVRVPGKGKEMSWATKVIKNNLDPEWNEEDELPGWEEGDPIEFDVKDWDMFGAHDDLGVTQIDPTRFFPKGFEGRLHLKCDQGDDEPTLNVRIEVIPKKQKIVVLNDPGLHVSLDMRWPVPFMFKCVETQRTHQLCAVTHIGRTSQLDAQKDLILKGPGNGDIGRRHAYMKVWQDDQCNWCLRVYDPKGGGGLGKGPGGGHAGGGTSVNGKPVHPDVGAVVKHGDVLRFGVNELWMLERAALFTKSVDANVATRQAEHFLDEDPSATRNLCLPSAECQAALKRCVDWLDFVRVVLEWLQELDEPPCVDVIEVRDERGKCTARHETASLEEQEQYPVKHILKDIRLGVTVHLRLSSDPCLLAPILQYLDDHRMRLERTYKDRDPIPD